MIAKDFNSSISVLYSLFQTIFSFHFPRLKTTVDPIAKTENAMVITLKTPFVPKPKRYDSV